MSAHIVFSNNDKIGSKIISWGSAKGIEKKLIPSHFSLCFKSTYVVESRLTSGVHANEWENFKSKNNIVAIFDVTEEIEAKYGKWYIYYQHIYKKILNKSYDWKALLYLAFYQARWKFFGKAIPENNKKNNPDKYFCVEVFEELFGENLSMYSPYSLMVKCRGRFKRLL